jgi:hypothetical protein
MRRERCGRKKSQGKPKTTTATVFSSNFTTAAMSFAAALRGTPEQNKRNMELVIGLHK